MATHWRTQTSQPRSAMHWLLPSSDAELHLLVTYWRVNRHCGERSVDVGQNVVVVVVVIVIIHCCVARRLRRRRSHVFDHVLSTRRQSASQRRARCRRWPRPHAVDDADEASGGGPKRRPRPRLPTARVQLGEDDSRLSTVAGRRRSHAPVRGHRTGSSAANIISTTRRRQ